MALHCKYKAPNTPLIKKNKQTVYSSLFSPSSATRLFCDVYNTQSKTYCKRLQVLCPEHSRDPKVGFHTLLQ